MAKLRAFAAFDSKLGIFMSPFFMAHVGQAHRMWEEVCNDPNSAMCKHPKDFVLYELGSFNDEDGRMESHAVPVQLSSAFEVKRKPQDNLPLSAVN